MEALISKGIFRSVAILLGATAAGFVIMALRDTCDVTFPFAVQSLGTVYGLTSALAYSVVGLRKGIGEPSLLQAILALVLLASLSLIRFTCIPMNMWTWFPWQSAGWVYLACAIILLIVSWVYYRHTRQVPQARS